MPTVVDNGITQIVSCHVWSDTLQRSGDPKSVLRNSLGIRVSGRLSLKTVRRGSGRTLTHPQRCAHGGRPCRAPRPRTAIVVSAVVGAAAAVGNGAHDRRLCARAAAPAHGAAGAASDGAWSWNINMRLEPLKT